MFINSLSSSVTSRPLLPFFMFVTHTRRPPHLLRFHFLFVWHTFPRATHSFIPRYSPVPSPSSTSSPLPTLSYASSFSLLAPLTNLLPSSDISHFDFYPHRFSPLPSTSHQLFFIYILPPLLQPFNVSFSSSLFFLGYLHLLLSSSLSFLIYFLLSFLAASFLILSLRASVPLVPSSSFPLFFLSRLPRFVSFFRG